MLWIHEYKKITTPLIPGVCRSWWVGPQTTRTVLRSAGLVNLILNRNHEHIKHKYSGISHVSKKQARILLRNYEFIFPTRVSTLRLILSAIRDAQCERLEPQGFELAPRAFMWVFGAEWNFFEPRTHKSKSGEDFSDFSFLFFFNVSFVYSRLFRELALMNSYTQVFLATLFGPWKYY